MPHPLASHGYVDEAADALAHGNVFVSREVSGASTVAQTLDQQIGDASIGVAVFSDNAALEASGPEIVSELATQTGYDTIVVAVGGDLSAGSRVLPSGEAMRIANEAESSAGSLDAALTTTVQEVVAATPAGAGGFDAGPLIGIVLAVAALVAAGGVLVGVVRARRRRAAGRKPLPEAVRAPVARLRALSGEYAAAASGRSGAGVAEVGREIAAVADNADELFARLSRTGDEGQRATAAIEYGETLRKLTAALDRDYLLDILRNPQLWDDPQQRVREVRDAVTAVSTELVENIKQVNARRGLHFQVSLDGLLGARKELQDWQREFDRAADDRPRLDPPPPSA